MTIPQPAYGRFWAAPPQRLPECDVCGEERGDVIRCSVCDELICGHCQTSETAFELGTCISDECMASAVRKLKRAKL